MVSEGGASHLPNLWHFSKGVFCLQRTRPICNSMRCLFVCVYVYLMRCGDLCCRFVLCVNTFVVVNVDTPILNIGMAGKHL